MSTPDPFLDHAETRTAAVVMLLGECTTATETNSVQRVALRAGFMWRCHNCKANHYLTGPPCSCGAERPDGLPG
ncbi:hypothetical protein [Streptomyces sp. A5-4]|uniref:hypothetical protein n=1 Tax=Streptomyces sp. A5-4 TaxID=3384771 RepID=UPI003DA8A6D6